MKQILELVAESVYFVVFDIISRLSVEIHIFIIKYQKFYLTTNQKRDKAFKLIILKIIHFCWQFTVLYSAINRKISKDEKSEMCEWHLKISYRFLTSSISILKTKRLLPCKWTDDLYIMEKPRMLETIK